MLIDASTLPANRVIETDVCIVGAGPAGVTLARELADQDFQVCLLESGGLNPDPETQALCEGKTISPQRYPTDELHVGRCRQFGGSANYWCIQIDRDENQAHVRHVTPDDIDFEQREWVPYSGWPFRKADLAPYYQKANAICKIGPDVYEAKAWEEDQAKPLSFQSDRIQSSVFQFGPSAVFTHDYREELQASSVTTYLNASVLEVETNGNASAVTGLRVASLDGKEFRVKARMVVLATGGFENARLLLLSDQVQKAGLGNQNDLVGRFFMDHPGFRFGVFIPASRELFNSTAFYDLRRVNGTPVMGKLSLSEAVLRQEQLLNICVMLVPRPSGYESRAVNSWRNLLSAAKRKQLPKDAWKHVKNVVSDLDDIVNYAYRRVKKLDFVYSPRMGGWSRRPADIRTFKAFEVIAQAEQAPNPDNRVTLTEECDRLGRRKVSLNWRWSDIDLETIKRVQQILAQEFAQSGLGEFQPRDQIEGGLPRFGSTHHHIGTTRMHPDPKQGVVDENCQVHGVANLFVAGSSVFPTGGGYANPTLTIVALAVRLADHVKTAMAANVSTVN